MIEEKIVEDDERYVMVQKGIIVAKDKTALNEYKRYAKRQKEKSKDINTLREDVETLKTDMNDIKSMLSELIKRNNQ